jgi:hypothetical protein
MMSIEYEDIIMPAVGILNTGDVLYRQTNGRLTTERFFDGTKDTKEFITLDINFDAVELPDSFEGCNFDESAEAMVYNGEDMIPIYNRVIRHSPDLPDDVCYNLYGKYHISASDIFHVHDSTNPTMYKQGNKIVCHFYMEGLSDDQLADIWNSIQESEEHNYINYLELVDGFIIPDMIHEEDDYVDIENEEDDFEYYDEEEEKYDFN